MRVKVELQAYLDKYAPNGQTVFEFELAEGATVQSLIRSLNLPEELASVIILNDTSADFSHPLHDGDRVTVIPPLAGG